MQVGIILIIIFGTTVGVLIFFLLKSISTPKKTAALLVMVRQGKNAAAIRAAKQILTKDPRNAEAHYMLGLAYLQDNKPELALMEMKTVNQISQFGGLCPEIAFRKNIAELYHRFHQPEEALKEYLLLIKLDGTDDSYYYEAGILFEERQRSDMAKSYYRKVIELNPKHSMVHYQLGQILFREKKPVEAKVELETSLKLQPENYKAYFYLGKLQKDSHDYGAALLSFERAQKDADMKVKAIIERGTCYMSMNNFERAISELERAIKLSTNDASQEILFGRYFLAHCYEKLRDIDKAVDQWEKIYLKKPAFKDVAEKLSQYQDLRMDDRIKDFMTTGRDDFFEICKGVCGVMNLSVRDITDIPNGSQIIAVESETKWRNARKMPTIIRFIRVPEMIDESSVRALHEEMKKNGVSRGIIFTSSSFTRMAYDFAETRPINLYNKDKLQELLKQVPR